MLMDLVVKIPRELVLQASEELNKIRCLRKNPQFQLFPGERWEVNYSCHGWGNGYGVGFKCKEDCNLRITDSDKLIEVKPRDDLDYTYWVQLDFYKGKD